MSLTDLFTSLGALFAGLAGCGWIGTTLWKTFFGGEERRANAAMALTGAAKLMVDELQEEVRAAREEMHMARKETDELRKQIREMRRLTDEEISQLRAHVAALREQNHDLLVQLARRPGSPAT